MRICSIKGCDSKHQARGYCSRCYDRMIRYSKRRTYRKKYEQSERYKEIMYKYNRSEKRRAWRREYEKTEKAKKMHRDWKKSESGKVSSRKHYQKKKEYYAEWLKGYRATEMGKLVRDNCSHKRRCQKQDSDITTDFLKKLKDDTKICDICRKELDGPIHLDHIRPLGKPYFGKHVMSNVRFVHAVCNLSRPKKGLVL